MLHVLKKVVYLQHKTTKKVVIMETKSNIDIAAKQLWQQICDFSNLLYDNIHDDDSRNLYLDFVKKSSEFARFIDKNFYND